MQNSYFSSASMIFAAGHASDAHAFVGFYTALDYNGQQSVAMEITACSFYKLYINGEFVSYGPVRAAHEYARVDTPDIKPYLREGINHIAAEVIGYCGKVSLAGTGEPSIFIAQIALDGVCVSATGRSDWKCYLLPQKELNTPPFSHARFWVENYTLTPDVNDWRVGKSDMICRETEIITRRVTFIPRVASCPDFAVHKCAGARYTRGIRKAEMTDRIKVTESDGTSETDFDFGEFKSGFIGLRFECEKPCTVTLYYQEKLSREEGEFSTEPSGQNAHTRSYSILKLSAGKHDFESFEPYALRYLRIKVENAQSYAINGVYVRLCQIKDLAGGGFLCSDGEINRIYRANRASLVLNTFDTFMDCAQRERGSGWNDCCYWCAPACKMMLGDLSVEKCYLQNQLADTVAKYCDLPYACYPASYRCVIHNWTIYLLLELYEYYIRSGDIGLLRDNRDGIDFLVASLNKFKNGFGLLENLPEIVYTSSYTTSLGAEANAVYNQPISTVTNMMFSRALRRLGSVLNASEWTEQADKIDGIIRQTIDNIHDDAENTEFPPSSIKISEDGRPVSTGYFSEGGLYFWICSGFFNKNNLPLKLNRVFEHLGPLPDEKYSHDLYYIKRMGYEGDFFARVMALSMYGKSESIIKEIKSYGLWAIDRFAGLLGEGWDWFSSNHHSFNAYFNYILQRELLGTDNADEVDKVIKIAPHICSLSWAEGYISTNVSICSVKWTNGSGGFRLSAEIPSGYSVEFTVPTEATGRDRAYLLDGKDITLSADGKITVYGDFTFESKRI